MDQRSCSSFASLHLGVESISEFSRSSPTTLSRPMINWLNNLLRTSRRFVKNTSPLFKQQHLRARQRTNFAHRNLGLPADRYDRRKWQRNLIAQPIEIVPPLMLIWPVGGVPLQVRNLLARYLPRRSRASVLRRRSPMNDKINQDGSASCREGSKQFRPADGSCTIWLRG